MIYANIPYNKEKNLGVAYNQFMKLLKDDDWAVFIDSDAMFLDTNFMAQIERYIKNYPDCTIFTAKTNRVGNKAQLYGSWEGDSIRTHKQVAEEVKYMDTVTDVTSTRQHLSGVVIVLKKSTWKKLGGFKENGIIGIDTDFTIRAYKKGEKILVMDGVYVYHWYRGGDRKNIKHLL